MAAKSPFPATEAPATPARDARIEQHGDVRVDPYAWLRAENWREVLSKPETLPDDIRAVLDAENAYYETVTADLEPLRDRLYAEMRGRIKENDGTPPAPDGPWLYWTAYREGGEHPIVKRKPREGGADQVVFDGDAEAAGSEFYSVRGFRTSPDHGLLAYAEDRVGSESYTVNVRDLTTGADLADAVPDVSGAPVWRADGKAFYYVDRDEDKRPRRVKRHVLGEPVEADRVIYEEPADDFFVGVSKSLDGQFIFIGSSSQTTSEVRFFRADADEEAFAPRLVAARDNGVEYDVDFDGEAFLILTNADGAEEFKIVRAPVDNPGREAWTDWLPAEDGVFVRFLVAFKDFVAVYTSKDALPRITLYKSGGAAAAPVREIAFDEAAYSIGLGANYEFDTTTLRFIYESPTRPDETFDYDMATGARTLIKRKEIPSGHDADKYVVERFRVTARDGAQVPVTLLRLAEPIFDGPQPTLLYGYGSYGAAIPASFSTNVLSLVDRGAAYAIAHIRGGSALGRSWYLDGKLETKINTFTDFVDVADALVKEGRARPGLVIQGGSAGGLLVGAAVNLRPDLFGGVVGQVPFVDVVNTISDASLPLTPPEWEEWGNPIESATDYERIKSWSPYDNIAAADYPPIFATGGLTDYRVTYWEPAKWVARLRATATGGPFLLRMNMAAGHAGSAARFERLEERAHAYAFTLACLGIADDDERDDGDR
ncbi:MAG: S9 family peptidase [Pseudomonadota bacterium]